jgi:tRNA(Phe) wybutosine-synthesizing methylase Tyw3
MFGGLGAGQQSDMNILHVRARTVQQIANVVHLVAIRLGLKYQDVRVRDHVCALGSKIRMCGPVMAADREDVMDAVS